MHLNKQGKDMINKTETSKLILSIVYEDREGRGSAGTQGHRS